MTDEPIEAPKPAKRRGRPPGLPRTPGSGRKKGQPNRVNGSIHDLMKAMGLDPRVVLIRIAANAKNPPELRRKAAADLMGYAWPKLNSVDTHLTGEVQQQVVHVFTGIARSPTSPPLSLEDAARWQSAIDVDATPALPPPDNGAPLAEDPSPAPDAVALPAGRPRSPAETGPSTPSSILPGRFDSKSDEVIDRTRGSDSKLADFNRRLDGAIT